MAERTLHTTPIDPATGLPVTGHVVTGQPVVVQPVVPQTVAAPAVAGQASVGQGNGYVTNQATPQAQATRNLRSKLPAPPAASIR